MAEQARVEELAARPLTRGQKILSFLGGVFVGSGLMLVILFFVWDGFRQRGEFRRAREMWRYVLYGFLSIPLLIFVLTVLLHVTGW